MAWLHGGANVGNTRADVANRSRAGTPPGALRRSGRRCQTGSTWGLYKPADKRVSGLSATTHGHGRVRESGYEPPGEWTPAPGLDGSCGPHHPPTYDINLLILPAKGPPAIHGHARARP